jgi:hypothetical protein
VQVEGITPGSNMNMASLCDLGILFRFLVDKYFGNVGGLIG